MSFGTAIATAVSDLLAPLSLALADRAFLVLLLDDLGWTLDDKGADLTAVQTLLPFLERLEEVEALVDGLESGESEPGELVELGVQLGVDIFETIDGLASLSSGSLSSLVAPLDDPATWVEIALDLPEYLMLRWVALNHPIAYAVLLLGGAIREVDRGPDKPPRRELDWAATQALLSDPPDHLATLYGWGGDFEHALLLERIARLCRAFGLQTQRRTLRSSLTETWYPSGPDPDVQELGATLFEGMSDDGSSFFSAGLLAAPVPSGGSGPPAALLLTHELLGSASGTVSLGDGWSLVLEAGADASGALGVVFSPSGVALATGDAQVDLSVGLVGAPETPWVLLGDGDGTRLELAGLAAEVAVRGSSSAPELRVSFDAADDLRLVIDPGEGDSFLGDVLGSNPLVIASGLALTWSSVSGWALSGGIGFEVTIPLGLTAGPLSIDSLRLALYAGLDGGSAEIATTGGLSLGPFDAVVEDIGIRAEVTPVARGEASGSAGAVDVTLSFKPPNGVGLAIDAGVVSGGGYLFIDADAGEYAGIVDLDLLGVGVTAIGLIATKMPDGSDGWSMFLSLSATFTGVQLGFGFTLNGLGGLIGLHRGLDEDALADGVRTGALDSILFPEDPIADAPRILSDLNGVFPPVQDQYVFGPVAKLGWGTPSLLTLDVGVVFQLPEPLTISLLGSLSALLPTDDAAIVELRVNVAGTLNATEGTLKIDASLTGSRVLTMALTGDMAVRASFLDDPSFLFSFGGFHPDYDPPDDFPDLERLGVALDVGEAVRIQLGGYFALTANTVQFGAELSLYASGLGFTVEGGVSFDALIQFKPFGFVVSLEMYISVRAGKLDLLGVYLGGKVSGPNPFYVWGTAEFKVLGIKTSFEVDQTFGDPTSDAPLETVVVEQLLLEALGAEDAWSTLLPAGDGAGVLVAATDPSALEVHPAGRVEVRQRLVPLGQTLDHYGNSELGGADSFRMEGARFGAETLASGSVEDVEDWFAAAQFFELDEAEKLSAPSFELAVAGSRLGDDAMDAGPPVDLVHDHEVVYKDPNVRPPERERTGRLSNTRAAAASLALGRALSLRARKTAGKPSSVRPDSAFGVSKPIYVATNAATGERVKGVRGSYYEARSRLRREDAALRPGYELEGG